MSPPIKNFDGQFRRGLVLGLSLAEIFLILLFIILISAFGLLTFAEEEKKNIIESNEKLLKDNSDLEDTLKSMEKILGKNITPDEFTLLVKKLNKQDQLEKQNEELLLNLKEAEDKLDILEDLRKIIKDIQIKPENLKKIINEKKDLAEAINEKELLKIEIKKLEKKIDKQDQVITEYSKKGDDPPCWFYNIKDETESDGIRQKHVKIFDVKIRDQSFEVRIHDKKTEEKNEVDLGNINSLPKLKESDLNRELTTNEFRKIFNPFLYAGKNKKIQPYKCKFMVDVYDDISKNNKKGYKRNLSTVERVFNKYIIQDNSW